MLSIKSNLEESKEAKMPRFLNGLNQDIQYMLELLKHETLEEMFHQAMKVERQIKRHHMYQKYASWNSLKEKKEYDKSLQGKSSNISSSSSSKDHKHSSSCSKDYKHSSSSKDHVSCSSFSPKPKFEEKTSSMKCFKCLGYGHKASNCPNKKVMVLKNGDIQSKHSSLSSPFPSSSSPSSPFMSTSSSSNYELVPQKSDLSIVRQMFGHVHKDIGDSQRVNIFPLRCLHLFPLYKKKHEGSCTTVTSKRLMDKLNLPTIPCSRPYKIL